MIADFRAQRAERQALETESPTIVSPPAPEMRVLVYSNMGLPEQEFRAQTEKLRQVASFDSDSHRGSIIGRPPVWPPGQLPPVRYSPASAGAEAGA